MVKACDSITAQLSIAQSKITVHKEYTYICPCPAENCKGLINADTFTCVLCSTKICENCRDPISAVHQCNPQIVKNIALLDKDSKPCPKCAVTIYRISGCDQMFCTICHVSFDWHSGEINTGTVHNPHAAEYMRMHGIRAIDECGIPDLETLQRVKSKVPYQTYAEIIRAWYFTAELNDAINFEANHGIVREVYQPPPQYASTQSHSFAPVNSFMSYRLMYVMGIITQADWMQKIYARERKSQRITIKVDILRTCTRLFTDVIRRFIANVDSPNFVPEEYTSELTRIIEYINETLRSELEPLGAISFDQIARIQLKNVIVYIHQRGDADQIQIQNLRHRGGGRLVPFMLQNGV